ncbi:MAG: UbiA family prenyltransferase, partial [bacterium]
MLAYVGGMILNDAFDAEIDSRERPARPIPSGRVGRRAAFAVGFALLAASIALALVAGEGATVVLVATALLALAVVVYNRHHTKSVASTLLLALCRALASLIPMLAFANGELDTLVTRGAITLP